MRVILTLTVLIGHLAHAQICCDSLFDRFKKDVQFELQRFKTVDWDDETKESFYTLMARCPIESLESYVEDSLPAIRAFIFGGLAQKNAENKMLAQIISKHENDTAEFTSSTLTWNIKTYMQTVLQWKIEGHIPNAAVEYETMLKEVQNRSRIIVPGKYHWTVSKDSLLIVDSLTWSVPGCRILSFEISSEVKSIVTNNLFTQEVRELLKAMKPNELLTIDNIKGISIDGKKVKYPSIALYIR